MVRVKAQNKTLQKYIAVSLKSAKFKDYIINHSTGSAQPQANAKVISSFPIIIPNAVSLSELDNKLTPILDEISLRLLENRILTELRDNLLPKLMSGEISATY